MQAESWYASKDHESFERIHDPAVTTGALLVHGYSGSPRDMRDIGRILYKVDIDVHAITLPGMAKDIGRRNDVRASDWIAAVTEKWLEIRERYDYAILVGHSLGGALAIHAAGESEPDLMILIAPLSRIAQRGVNFLPIGKRFIKNVTPYRNATWNEEFLKVALPGLDMTDPKNVEFFKTAQVSVEMLASLVDLVKKLPARRQKLTGRTVIVQGTEDGIVHAAYTRSMMSSMGGRVTLHEIPGDHFILFKGFPYWKPLERILKFEIKRWRADLKAAAKG